MKNRRVVDARADSDGDITHVKIEGNSTFTPLQSAINMAKRGELENVHVSKTGRGREYLRTNPDRKRSNNLDTMAGDT